MQHEDVIKLITAAVKNAGNETELSRLIESTPQRINDWKHGRTTVPPADVVLLAHVAGFEPQAWAARALIAKHEGTRKGEKLFQALKKWSVATGAAIATSGASAATLTCLTDVAKYLRCIYSKVIGSNLAINNIK